MVAFNDPFGQGEPKSPASFTGSKTGIKHLFEHTFFYALSGVGNVDVDKLFAFFNNDDIDLSLSFHGIYRIFTDILHHPFEK